ncbi:ABC transporter permease subunit [Azospirillum picis]|uniref:ABC-type dipeptide/oligopeptide/nickel transport system permease component n=1 Tax=Azospirillum picis TaxID=488438 RepID=A0ABU0ME34_9PROT|nr:ABC transporter permease subunit [Azospirillum picis]MBP2297451.1 ABC-type dipeptide/oligopeptide/nickel transport system permease component [Azospirillum picis]MDQ0531526.1 ABC-type dipeptide/oligopeptide/nickel transport system permease component [Azospirillum picis]
MQRSLIRRLIDAVPTAFLPMAAAVALAAAIAPQPGASLTLLRGLAVTLLLTLPSLAVGTTLGTLAGSWAAVAPRSAGGLFGRLLAGAGPLVPGFLLAAVAALAVRAGASPAPLGWTALAIPAACQAARLARPAMARALGPGSEGGAVRMARGLGLDERTILRHHALPQAVVPVMTGLRSAVMAAMVGAVALESLLDLPGAGSLMIDGARAGSAAGVIPPLVALAGLTALLVALGAAVRDWIDPANRSAMPYGGA